MTTRTFLALVGSPRANSTSESIARYLADGLAARGWTTEIIVFSSIIRHPERWEQLEAAYRRADVIGLCFPLYVDCLPSEMTEALERLATVTLERRPGCFGVCQCGFLEAEQNDPALAICRVFAREAGLDWLGELAIGAGGAMGGGQWRKMGNMMAHVLQGLDQTIDSLDAGAPISDATHTLVRKRFCSPWMYLALANISMLAETRKNGALWRINAQPYK